MSDREIAAPDSFSRVTDSKKNSARTTESGNSPGKSIVPPGVAANVVLIGPEKYNALYEKFANLE